MKLRRATLDDLERLLAWRNDPATVAASLSSRGVGREEHARWLRGIVDDPRRGLFVVLDGDQLVGTVRADLADDAHELSWTVAPEARGRGLGKRMVVLLADRLPGPLTAQVKTGNVASRRIAESIGMRLVGETEGVLYYRRESSRVASATPSAEDRSMVEGFEIAGRVIGPDEPTYIVAEMSANHGHDFDRAVELIHAAHRAGADAIKLQTYTADTLTIDSDAEPFQIGAGTLWEGRNLYDLYGEAMTPWAWQPKLKEIAEGLGMPLFSTPFDASAVDFLEAMDVPAHKVASFEIVDLELIRRIAETGKPMIVSTGMATLAEIDEAVATIRATGNKNLALLVCTSAYPSPPEAMNLRTIPHLARAFGVPTGLSDHTMGIAVPVAAVALGARIIEKHFTLSRDEPGPDSAFSLEPHEFAAMVDAVRTTEKALGRVRYGVGESEKASRVFRRSLFVVEDIAAGEPFTRRNVRSIRPGHGLAPKHLPQVLGRRAARDLTRGTPLEWDGVGGPADDG